MRWKIEYDEYSNKVTSDAATDLKCGISIYSLEYGRGFVIVAETRDECIEKLFDQLEYTIEMYKMGLAKKEQRLVELYDTLKGVHK